MISSLTSGPVSVRSVDKVDAAFHRALQHFACFVAVFGLAPDAGARQAHGSISEPVDGEVSTHRKIPAVSVCNVVIPLQIRRAYDWFLIVPATASIVGAGPNGLSAAIVLANAGFAVEVREAASVAGGAARSAELTLPGFVHDLGSAVDPMAVTSPFFSTLPLEEVGLRWIWPSAELAHPLDDGTAVILERDVGSTACQLGTDAAAYRRLYAPLLANWDGLRHDLLKAIGWPRHPIAMARFGLLGLRSARALADGHFKGIRARALFAGLAAHSFLPLESPVSAAFGLVLGTTGHAVGWPIPQGGAQSIADALVVCLRRLVVRSPQMRPCDRCKAWGIWLCWT